MSAHGNGGGVTRAGPLQWRSGAGWIVLGGGGSWRRGETDEIDAAALGWADLDRPIAVLPTAGGSTTEAEALLDYYADLGGPNGYVVPVFDAVGAQLPKNCRLLEEAGLIHAGDGPEPLTLVRALRDSPAMEAVTSAFERGAVILGVGAGAAALGAWLGPSERPGGPAVRAERGLAWLINVVVAPHFEGTKVAHRLQGLLDLKPSCLGLGIPDRVGLGLGPVGEVESIGPGQVTVVVSGLEVET